MFKVLDNDVTTKTPRDIAPPTNNTFAPLATASS